MPFPVRIEEEIKNDKGHFFVLAKGEPAARKHPFAAFTNKGYLMLILAVLILILLVVKYST